MSVLLMVPLLGCGRDLDVANIRDNFNDRVVRAQVAVESKTEEFKHSQALAFDYAEREALQDVEAHADEAAQDDARLEAERKAAAAATAAAAKNPYAGAPAEQLSSQLQP